MANMKVPTDKTVRRDFETGTVQPGPGMAPAQPPAEDMQQPGAAEEFKGRPAGAEHKDQQKPSGGGCGCGCG